MYANCQHLFASTHDTTPTPSADNRHGNRNNGIWQNNDAEIFQKDFSDVDSSQTNGMSAHRKNTIGSTTKFTANSRSSDKATPVNLGQQTMFTISAEPPPTCMILVDTCDEAIANWRAAHIQFRRKLDSYNRQYGTSYDPPVQRWVTTDTWRILSADLLLPEDSTDPVTGEPPNDSAVTNLLLQQGKYADKTKKKIGAYGYVYAHDEFVALKWSTQVKMKHTARLDAYLTSWFNLAARLHNELMPRDKELCKIMLQAVQPDALRKRIEARTHNGCGPSKLSMETQQWRKDARKQLRYMRRLIREHTNHVDNLNSCTGPRCPEYISHDPADWNPTPAITIVATAKSDTAISVTSSDLDTEHEDNTLVTSKRRDSGGTPNGSTAPICCLEECNRTCHKYKHGHYATTCTREHHKIHRERHRRRQQRVQTVPDS
jgi:hypothetical protein